MYEPAFFVTSLMSHHEVSYLFGIAGFQVPMVLQDEIPCYQAPIIELPCRPVDAAFEDCPLSEQGPLLRTLRPCNRCPEASSESPPHERMYYCIVILLGLKGISVNGTGAELCGFQVPTLRNEPVSNEAVRHDWGRGEIVIS